MKIVFINCLQIETELMFGEVANALSQLTICMKLGSRNTVGGLSLSLYCKKTRKK